MELMALTAEALDLRSQQISKDQELADLRQKHAEERDIRTMNYAPAYS